MTKVMTNNEVIEILAKREGWKAYTNELWVKNFPLAKYGWPNQQLKRITTFRYLDSKDALQPVLEKLNEGECSCLFDALTESVSTQTYVDSLGLRALLTLPANQLAHAIAEAIKEVV